MREYNLFVIKSEYVEIYKNKPLFLFEILNNLFNLSSNFNYGVTLYDQLCNHINIDTLKYYLNSKYNLDNSSIFNIDNVYIELRYSRIIVKSKYNLPRIIKAFNCYNRNIFICDFINNDYFWLNDFIRTEVLQHI